jgi:hypothetical protein
MSFMSEMSFTDLPGVIEMTGEQIDEAVSMIWMSLEHFEKCKKIMKNGTDIVTIAREFHIHSSLILFDGQV